MDEPSRKRPEPVHVRGILSQGFARNKRTAHPPHAAVVSRTMPLRRATILAVGLGNGLDRERMKEKLLFAQTFFKRPRALGSLVPSSRFLVRQIMEQVDWSARVIVEYGPGVGTLTEVLLQRMHPKAVLVAIDSSPEFVSYLRGKYCDARLRVIEGSAADVASILRRLELGAVDCIISGIPYSTIPTETRERILAESHAALRPGGGFIVYQFSNAVLPHLKRFFGPVEEYFELRNILPARIFYCSRNGKPAPQPKG
jgi:phospholipid N-methyltransferase